MASFIIHHIAGYVLLNKIEDTFKINIPNIDKNMFLLGNLIVDFEVNKNKTHFRDNNNEFLQIPNTFNFIKKYKKLLYYDISTLGYLFHLHIDRLFFSNFFNENITLLDINNNETNNKDKVKNVFIKSNNKIYLKEEIFNKESELSIYKDYTKMNRILLDKYDIKMNYKELLESIKYFKNPGIEEVDYNDIDSILYLTAKYIIDSYKLTENKLLIFNLDSVYRFIDLAAERFLKDYNEYILFNKTKKLSKTIE